MTSPKPSISKTLLQSVREMDQIVRGKLKPSRVSVINPVGTPMPTLQRRAIKAINQHGGLRAAARKLRINHTTLSHLADGKRTGASERTLRALGLTKKVRVVGEGAA